MTPALFFDLDGTLCYPATPFPDVFYASLAPLLTAHPTVDRAALLTAWVAALERPGPATTTSCLAWAFAHCNANPASPIDAPDAVDAPDTTLLTRCADALNTAWAAAQRPAPDLWPALAAAQARYRLGIITNGPDDAQRAVVDALGLASHIRWLVVSGDPLVGVRKPDPAIFRHALTLAQAEPGETWYVGDSPTNDVGGAVNAGMRACWLAPGDAALPDGIAQPEMRVASLGELAARLLADAD